MIKHFKIINKSVLDYGRNQLTTVLSDPKIANMLERTEVTSEKIQGEFSELKKKIFQNHQAGLVDLSWSDVNKQYRQYSNFLSLVDLLLTMPSHSADAERGFSALKKQNLTGGLVSKTAL